MRRRGFLAALLAPLAAPLVGQRLGIALRGERFLCPANVKIGRFHPTAFAFVMPGDVLTFSDRPGEEFVVQQDWDWRGSVRDLYYSASIKRRTRV